MVASVGDWNNNGYNDIIGYNKTTGNMELHLGNGNGTFGPAIVLAHVGTNVKFMTGPGKLPGGSAPILWYETSDGVGHFLTSNDASGVTGAPKTSTPSSGSWSPCNAIFATPRFLSNGNISLICETGSLVEYVLQSNGNATYTFTYGSGWNVYGSEIFGSGDWNGNGIGDIIGVNSAGNMILYTGNGDGTTSGSGSEIGSGWTDNYVTGGYDINGDGHPDILRLTSSGLSYYPSTASSGVLIN